MKKILLILLISIMGFAIYAYFVVLPRVGTGTEKNYSQSVQFSQVKMKFQNQDIDPIDIQRKKVDLWVVFKKFFFGEKITNPTAPFPEGAPNLNRLLNDSSAFKFIWLGHSSFIARIGGKTILIDPVFSPAVSPSYFFSKRFQKPVISLEDLPIIDYVLISHDHYDHLDADTIKHFSGSKTRFLVPLGISSYLESWGIESQKVTELDWWQKASLGGLSFYCTPSQHFSGRLLPHQNNTLWASWVIRSNEFNLFYSGDSGYSPHFKEIGKKLGPFNLAFIENGQYGKQWSTVHLHPDETVKAFKDIDAKYFVPVHWGMFNLSLHNWFDPPQELIKIMGHDSRELLTPLIGELVDMNDLKIFPRWWQAQMSKALK